MKKLFLLVSAICLITTVSAQENVIKTNPLSLALGNFNATYERVVSPGSSILINGNYTYRLLGMDVSLAGLGAGYRYYITHKKLDAPAGFYINPQAQYGYGSVEGNQGENISGSTVGVGLALGYQWIRGSGFTIDLGIGPMYNRINIDDSQGSGMTPFAILAIGYAF